MLPYQTLQEAKIALGRELTYAETLWFNYSATKSDHLLYAHNLLFLLCFHSLVPLPLALLELKGLKMMDKYKLQPKVKLSLRCMLKCYKETMRVYITVGGFLILITYPAIKWVGIHTSLQLPSIWEVLPQVLVYFMVEDYGQYWCHRLLHCKWPYEKIHKVHHEFTAPFGFAASYLHWAETSILGFLAILGPAMAPCHMITFWLWIIVRQIKAIEAHCGYEFPWSPAKYIPFYACAEFHDYHHFFGGRCKSNFAQTFTYCDYIYGTLKKSKGPGTKND